MFPSFLLPPLQKLLSPFSSRFFNAAFGGLHYPQCSSAALAVLIKPSFPGCECRLNKRCSKKQIILKWLLGAAVED